MVRKSPPQKVGALPPYSLQLFYREQTPSYSGTIRHLAEPPLGYVRSKGRHP